MNLDELKNTWQQYNVKLQSTQALSKRIIISMIRERSQSRLSKIKRRYLLEIIYLLAWLIAGIAVLGGNPFDYTQEIEYIPIAIYCVCMGFLIVAMIKFYINLQAVKINQDTLEAALNKIIGIVGSYEKPKKYTNWALRLLLFSGTVLFPLSFLPRKIHQSGLSEGIVDTLIPIAISASLVLVAYKTGAFKGRQEKRFRDDLKELEQLTSNHNELLTGSD